MIKINSNQPATKDDLKALRGEVKGDLDKLEKRFDTKLSNLDKKMSLDNTKLEIKMDKMEERFDNKMTKLRDDLLTSNDKLIGKLDKFLTEQQAINENYKRMDKQVEKVEDYVEKADQKLELDFERT